MKLSIITVCVLIISSCAIAQETTTPIIPKSPTVAPTPIPDSKKFEIMQREWKKKAIEAQIGQLREKYRQQLESEVAALQKQWTEISQQQTETLRELVPEGYELDGDLQFKVKPPTAAKSAVMPPFQNNRPSMMPRQMPVAPSTSK